MRDPPVPAGGIVGAGEVPVRAAELMARTAELPVRMREVMARTAELPVRMREVMVRTAELPVCMREVMGRTAQLPVRMREVMVRTAELPGDLVAVAAAPPLASATGASKGSTYLERTGLSRAKGETGFCYNPS